MCVQQIKGGIVPSIGSSEWVAKALIIGVIPARKQDMAMSCLPKPLPKRTIVVRFPQALSSSQSLMLFMTNKLLVKHPQAKAFSRMSQFMVKV